METMTNYAYQPSQSKNTGAKSLWQNSMKEVRTLTSSELNNDIVGCSRHCIQCHAAAHCIRCHVTRG